MLPSPEAPAPSWSVWLRALWGEAAQLAVMASPADAADHDGTRCVLTAPPEPRRLHMPLHIRAAASRQWGPAATAHAAAHWRFGGPPQPRGALKPVQAAIFGLLEDARVEGLALEELPGLRDLWLPFHQSPEASRGSHFEALLARLAHSLLDPRHEDSHPWVAHARAAGNEGQPLASRPAVQLRALASRLGNDIGQMRLAFNARNYHVHAAYRDDNSHLWEQDPGQPPSETPLADGSRAGTPERTPGEPETVPSIAYAEWDYRIARYRPAWCHVRETQAWPSPAARAVGDEGLRRQLAGALAFVRGRGFQAAGAAAWGDDFHPAALVDAQVSRRLGLPADAHVYRASVPRPVRLSVLLLLDASASSQSRLADGAALIDRMLDAAHACAGALDATGHRSALMAFSSRTRHRVDLAVLKRWDEPARSPAVTMRCAGLQAGGSTRLGAALRHATEQVTQACARRPGERALVLVLSDGQAHDIDVHDPLYLAHDFRRAVSEAAARGVAVRCVHPGAWRGPGFPHRALAALLA